MVNTQPGPSAPPQAKVDLAPPDEPAANNGSVAIDLESIPVTNAVPIVRDARVGGIVIESSGAKSNSEDGSGNKRCNRKKVLLVSLAVLVIAGVGAGLAIALTPKSDDSARSSATSVKAHPLLPDCKIPNPSLVGDGICNGGLYNTAECLWDAGDCIYYNTMYPNCHVPNPSLIGDGNCDGNEYDTEQCDWDGGDCPVAGDEDTTDQGAAEPTTGSKVLSQGGTPSAPASEDGNTAAPREPQTETSVYVQPDLPAETTPTTPSIENQEPSSDPNFPTIVTSDATCSLGSDNHYCTTDDDCVEIEVEDCSVFCQDEYACKEAEFADSVVSCYGRSSCSRGVFHRSEVTCLKEKDWPCYYSNFHASSVVCENNNGSFNSCYYATFDPCSCCDGPDCPSGVASCSGSGLQAFCSSVHLGKTCKAWGNPACTDISVAPNDSNEMHAISTSDSTCSLGSDNHYCTTDDDCVEIEVEDCSVFCQDEYACKEAEFADSVVSCYGRSSCSRGVFHRSEVTCLKEKDWPCYYSNFHASSVVCENNNGSFNSCYYATFDPCSCCDGPDCPSGVASCSGSGLQAFCSSVHLGKTCKAWGNPACTDISVAPNDSNEMHAISTSDSTCSLGSDNHYCTTDDDCVEIEVEDCSVFCQDEYACKEAEFADSVVSCYGRSSCSRGVFHRSEVTCLKEKDWPCYYSNFHASSVVCENNNGSFNSCYYATFDPCSCCDGPDCPSGVASCSGSGLQAFCSSVHLGKTCKAWGNPACTDISVAPNDSNEMHAISTSDSTCSLGSDNHYCTTDDDCVEIEVEDCSVFCQDEYACKEAEFADSVVSCYGRSSCSRGVFHRSEVTCLKEKDWPCYYSNFHASSVVCENNNGSFNSCYYATFDPCSCCDGPDCPSGVASCSGSGLQAFCSSVHLGKTCKAWGNPACNA